LPFRSILSDLLLGVPGSIGAMFLDYEGETVELLGHNINADDLRIIGAYQGIFLDQLARLSDDAALGTPARMKIEFRAARILSSVMKDGYYLVLVIGPGANEGQAWRKLDECRDRLMHEI
jgi:predicted regulator of Ras-like GTPase activity (Roadblock/LC7/MglB family)